MNNHGIELNSTKTQTMLIGTPSTLNKIYLSHIPKISVNNTEINYSHVAKYLGYTFNDNFNSTNQVNEIIRKVNFSNNKINHRKKSKPDHAKTTIIKSIIFPIFDYSAFIYHGHGITGTLSDQKRLQMAQNVCVRFMSNVNRFSRITPILNKMCILNLFNRRQFLILCFVHKIVHGNSVPCLCDIFAHCVSEMWNTLPSNIRKIESHNIFRKEIYNYLMDLQKKINIPTTYI